VRAGKKRTLRHSNKLAVHAKGSAVRLARTGYNDDEATRSREAAMILEGTIINGQVVLDVPHPLPEGAKVRVEIQRTTAAREEWLRRLRSAATDCGVSISNEALSSEGLYD
jgi:hypothetical protein